LEELFGWWIFYTCTHVLLFISAYHRFSGTMWLNEVQDYFCALEQIYLIIKTSFYNYQTKNQAQTCNDEAEN